MNNADLSNNNIAHEADIQLYYNARTQLQQTIEILAKKKVFQENRDIT